MSMTFLITVEDDGSCKVDQLAAPASVVPTGVGRPGAGLVSALRDPSFETGTLGVGERMDIHVKLSERVKRDVIITVLDDTVPEFASPEEAEAWMAERQSGPTARYG